MAFQASRRSAPLGVAGPCHLRSIQAYPSVPGFIACGLLLIGLVFAAHAGQDPVMIDIRPYVLSPETSGPLLEDVWPTLAIGPSRAEEIARKARDLPWAAALLHRMREEAATVRKQPPAVPRVQTGWRHDFFSPATGEPLIYEADQPDAFRVPSTGERERGAAQARAWALLTHERTARLMRGLALLYRIDGRPEDAEWVLDGFRSQASWWGDPRFGRPARFARGLRARHFSILYDASTLIVLADAWACVRDLADDDLRSQVEDGIFAERAPVIEAFLAQPRGLRNMNAYAAVALIRMGAAAGRPEWIEAGLNPEHGLAAILEDNLHDDGLWNENTMFYHFYALVPLIGAAEALLDRDGKLDPQVRRHLGDMLEAPWRITDSRLRLPAFGDLGCPRTSHLGTWRYVYEWAAGRLDPERFGPMLAAITEAGFPRRDLAALAYGPDDPGPAAPPPAGHDLLGESGLALLRGEGPDAPYVVFRGGRYNGGHDHPDRLGLILHVGDALLSPDLGEAGYALRDGRNRAYHRMTPGHNTLFADEREQVGTARITRDEDGALTGVIGRDRQGVSFRRRVRLVGDHLLVLDRWQSGRPVRGGWIHHGPGRLDIEATAEALPDLPPLPDSTGWRELADRQVLGARAWRGSWQPERGIVLAVSGVADGPAELTVSVAPGNPFIHRQGVLLLRLPGTDRRVASVFSWSRGNPPDVEVRLTKTGMVAVLPDGRTVELDDTP